MTEEYQTYDEYAAKLRAERELIVGLADVARQAMFEVLTDTSRKEPKPMDQMDALSEVDEIPDETLEVLLNQLGVVGVDEASQIRFARSVGRRFAVKLFRLGTLEKQ